MRGESLDFLDLVSRLPEASRPHLLVEERNRLEAQIAQIDLMLEGKPAQSGGTDE